MPDAVSFDDLPLSERARDAVHALGWRAPTPIQQAVVPQLVAGRDVIGRAQTGSGKTAAFGLHLTDAVKAPGLQALVLAPTRELVVQIADALNALALGADFRAVAVHGGVPIEPQLAALRDEKTTCLVATTGRLLDLIGRGQAGLDDVRHVVIDEADRMLDLGFLPEVERILRLVPGGRQTALFTATMPKRIAQLAHRNMAHARDIEVGAATPASAEHHRVDVASIHKMAALKALLVKEDPKRALVFVRTREHAEKVAWELDEAGFQAAAFHGSRAQQERADVVEALRRGDVRVVVATDVAARGLDIEGITHVVNHDVPEEAEQYVHRAGRTARAGRKGRVFTLVTENDGAATQAAERAAQLTLKPYPLAFETPEGTVEAAKEPVPARPEAPGGYARGARRKRSPTPAKSASQRVREAADEPVEEGRKEGEFDLPASRRERRRRRG